MNDDAWFNTIFAYLLYHENEAGKKRILFVFFLENLVKTSQNIVQVVFLRYRLIYDAKLYVTLTSQLKKFQI